MAGSSAGRSSGSRCGKADPSAPWGDPLTAPLLLQLINSLFLLSLPLLLAPLLLHQRRQQLPYKTCGRTVRKVSHRIRHQWRVDSCLVKPGQVMVL